MALRAATSPLVLADARVAEPTAIGEHDDAIARLQGRTATDGATSRAGRVASLHADRALLLAAQDELNGARAAPEDDGGQGPRPAKNVRRRAGVLAAAAAPALIGK